MDLFEYADGPLKFDGATYDSAQDRIRLTGQALRVWNIMKGGHWRTLEEISRASEHFGKSDSEAAVSARLRDYRKERFGEHCVERRARGGRHKGLFEYRLLINFLSAKPEQLL